jgi:hypothetical protein
MSGTIPMPPLYAFKGVHKENFCLKIMAPVQIKVAKNCLASLHHISLSVSLSALNNLRTREIF